MKTLYLHIGSPKTGTSSIQTFLKNNADRLHEYNYSYPLFQIKYHGVPIQRNGYFLILQKDCLANPETEEPTAEWNENYQAALGMIHEEFQKYDNVILSEETLWNAILYDALSFLKFFPKDIAAKGYQIKVVVYLRRQDQFLTSLWNQKIKTGNTDKTLTSYIRRQKKQKPLYADYDGMLREVAAVIGPENIIVRRFDPAFWVDHSICSDFLEAIGLDHTLPFEPLKANVNLSLRGNTLEIQRLINSADFLTDKERRQFSNYSRSFSASLPSDTPTPHLSRKATKALLAEYAEGNEHIAREYLRDGKPLFSNAIIDLPDWKPGNSDMAADAVRYFLTVTHDLKEENLALIEANKELNREVKSLRAFHDKVRHPVRTILHKVFKRQ